MYRPQMASPEDTPEDTASLLRLAQKGQAYRTTAAKLGHEWTSCVIVPDDVLKVDINFPETIKFIETNYNEDLDSDVDRAPLSLVNRWRKKPEKCTIQPEGKLVQCGDEEVCKAMKESLEVFKRVMVKPQYHLESDANCAPAAILSQISNVPDGYTCEHLRWQVARYGIIIQEELGTLYKKQLDSLHENLGKYLRELCLRETPWDRFAFMLCAMFLKVSMNDLVI